MEAQGRKMQAGLGGEAAFFVRERSQVSLILTSICQAPAIHTPVLWGGASSLGWVPWPGGEQDEGDTVSL